MRDDIPAHLGSYLSICCCCVVASDAFGMTDSDDRGQATSTTSTSMSHVP